MVTNELGEEIKSMDEVMKDIDSINETYYFECLSCGTTISKVGDTIPKNCSCGKPMFKSLGIYWDKQKTEGKEKKKQLEFNALKNSVLQLIIIRQEDKATEEVVKYILDNYKIKSIKQDKTSEIWFYQEGVMKPNGESQIKEICRNVLGEAFTPQRANKVISKVQADTFIEADEFFKAEQENKDEIPTQKTILNIKTKEESPFTTDKIFFNKINAIYDSSKDCPEIKKFLSDIVKNKEDVEVIFEVIGSMLYKKYFPQTSIMLLGDGENGKGVLESLMRTFLGAENCSSIPLNQMTSDSFSVAEMFGKLANLSGDISNTDLKETGRFKELCSGTDLVSAKRKFMQDLRFVNYAKLVFSCNELPRSYDLSHGFWRRWLILEFPYKFLKQKEYDLIQDKTNIKLADSELIEKLTTTEEMSGLLNEALKGLHRLLENKQHSYTKSTAEVKDFWIRKSDSFTAFCYDCLEESTDGFISKKDLRRAFNIYCKKHKVKGASDKNIKAVLEDMFGVVESRINLEYSWEGIRFKSTIYDIHHISPHNQTTNLHIGSKTLDTLDSLTKQDLINTSGLTEKEAEEIILEVSK